jgi:outer membrane protein
VRRAWLCLLATAALSPLAAKEFRVGYVNTDRIIERYEAAIEAKTELNAAIAKFEARADSLKTDYEQAKAEYESQQLTLSEEGKRAKQAEVDQRKRRYDAYLSEVYGTNGRIDQKNRELIAPIVERIDSVVSRLAASEGYSLVLDAAKTGIVYSEAGIDLTELVVAELNARYEPVTPILTKTVYALMRVHNSNDQAERDRVGAQIRDFAYRLIADQPNVEMVANAKVDQELGNRGYGTGEVTEQQALDVARALDTQFALYGKCSKQDRRISFELTLVNVRLGTVIKTQAGEAARQEDLQEQIAGVVRILLASVQ